jgi:hypothetical protein
MFVAVSLRWLCSNGNRVSSYKDWGHELFLFFLPSSCFLNIMCIKVRKYKNCLFPIAITRWKLTVDSWSYTRSLLVCLTPTNLSPLATSRTRPSDSDSNSNKYFQRIAKTPLKWVGTAGVLPLIQEMGAKSKTIHIQYYTFWILINGARFQKCLTFVQHKI